MPRYNPAPGGGRARGDGWQLVVPSDGELPADPGPGRQGGRELRASSSHYPSDQFDRSM